MEKKNIDWANLGFGYMKTDYRYVSDYTNGAWDEGRITDDDMITMSECAGVLQYAQTVFEGMKAYTTEKGETVVFRPDLMQQDLLTLQDVLRCRFSRKRDSLMLSTSLLRQTLHGFLRSVQVQHCISDLTCSVSIP